MHERPIPASVFTLVLVLAHLLGMAVATTARAADFDLKDVKYTIEPVVGYELSQKSDPSPHAKLVLIYGARVTAGWKIVAGEGEFTRGSSDEEFADQTLRIQETTEKAKLGLRSTYDLAPFASVTARAGGEASRRQTSTTAAGIKTERESPTKVAPYVGGGLSFALHDKVALSAEGTATLKDLNDLGQCEYQGTFGLKLSL